MRKILSLILLFSSGCQITANSNEDTASHEVNFCDKKASQIEVDSRYSYDCDNRVVTIKSTSEAKKKNKKLIDASLLSNAALLIEKSPLCSENKYDYNYAILELYNFESGIFLGQYIHRPNMCGFYEKKIFEEKDNERYAVCKSFVDKFDQKSFEKKTIYGLEKIELNCRRASIDVRKVLSHPELADAMTSSFIKERAKKMFLTDKELIKQCNSDNYTKNIAINYGLTKLRVIVEINNGTIMEKTIQFDGCKL